ncbi:PREDICTED: heat stress transcription factor A-1d isoform X2 [Tarenaya hassleriana]|uniref:heat stress transcription factor A-1d isoform X2 n=1 Tax=Tarenaya hassleriana TaxID=28532 RepID=UPI00053C273E|nr:PREDICTED: heat stress transcription factor A-1d isoform X2 [Tarenaya hassleriana]XP_010540763.1 PREDICTED: heat stress transcription factor A-1d isoform X2 [Tarenaya hassleriana]
MLIPLGCSFFVKQGFRKVDPDRWEFANEGFLRGQRHLLKTITRRKPAHGHQHSHGQNSSVGACVEVGKFGLEEEVERLKRDKNVLMQELVRLRQQQQSTDNQLQKMVQRLQGMEQRQQQIMSFLAKAVQNPHFLAQFLQQQQQQQQQQNEGNRCISEANKKRRLKQEGIAEDQNVASPDGQIVKYQPPMHEQAKSMIRQLMKMEPYKSGDNTFLLGNDTSSPSHVSGGVTLQEMPPTSLPHPSSDIDRFPESEEPTKDSPDLTLPEFSEMIPEGIAEVPAETFMEPFTGYAPFVDSDLLANGSVPFDIDDIPPGPEMDLLVDYSSLLEDYLASSPVADDMDSASGDVRTGSNETETEKKQNGWDEDRAKHMDKLTEQMGLLSPEIKDLPRFRQEEP